MKNFGEKLISQFRGYARRTSHARMDRKPYQTAQPRKND